MAIRRGPTAFSREGTDYILTRGAPDGSFADKGEMVELLASAYVSSESNNFVFGHDIPKLSKRAPELQHDSTFIARVDHLRWLYLRVLGTYEYAQPEVYRVHRGSSGSLVGILFLRSYDHRKRIVVRESPSAHDPNIFEQIWLGFLFIPMKFGVGVFRRIMSHGLGGSLVHKKFAHINGLHKRIDFVATSPVCQGQGIATEVLNAVCADADDEGTLLYLSATDRSKQLYYERFGFRVVGEGRSHPSAAHATTGMARMPKGRADAGEEVREVGDVVASSAQGNGRMPSALVRVALPLAGFTFAVWVGWSRKGSKGCR